MRQRWRRLFPPHGLYSGGPPLGAFQLDFAKLMTDPLLVQAAGLGIAFSGKIQALAGVDLAVPPGQFVSIVGPSGCGKSTLLRLIAGLAQATEGSLQIAGQSPKIARRERGHMSFVFQDPTLLPWRSVARNIALPLELLGFKGPLQAERVAQGLRMIALEEFAARFPSQLSGGMRMRVSLARALVTEPELLLLDEPFAALDDITRQTLGEELLELWARQHWTGIFVTHNIAEAVFLSERVLVMSPRPGRIVADIAIPFAAPRRPELRATGEFAALTGQIGAQLRRVAA